MNYLQRHLQGELSDVEKEHVAELLDSDAAARQQFVEVAQWDTELGETIREHAEPKGNKDLLPSGKELENTEVKTHFCFLRSLRSLPLPFCSSFSVASCTYRDKQILLRKKKSFSHKQRAAQLPRSPG